MFFVFFLKKKDTLNNLFVAWLTVKIFSINYDLATFSIQAINFVQWRTLLYQKSSVCFEVLATILYAGGLDN